MVEWNIRDLQKRRGASDATKEMLPKRVPVPKSHPELTTPEIAKIMADVVLRKVWELNAVADDHLPDDRLDFMERSRP